MRDRIELVEKVHPKISLRKQCTLLGVARSTVDFQAVVEDPEDIRIKRLLDEIYLIDPCLGSRCLVTVLGRDYGVKINRKRVQRLRGEMGQETIWCQPRTSIAGRRNLVELTFGVRLWIYGALTLVCLVLAYLQSLFTEARISQYRS